MRRFTAYKKRGDANMCIKIREVNSLTPEMVLQKFWDQAVPVDVTYILKNAGVFYQKKDFSKLESSLGIEKNDAILGLALSRGNDLGILCSTKLDKTSINYVLAHELAHCVLHLKPSAEYHVELKLSKDLFSENRTISIISRYLDSRKELQADRFAADLLVPTNALQQFLKKKQSIDIASIANNFQVSKEVVRLKILNLRWGR